MQAFGKVSAGSRRVNAYVYGARDADLREGHAAGLQRHRPAIRVELESCHRAKQGARLGADAGQRNGNVDVVISNGAYATFRAGYFHDRYTDTGIPTDDELHISDRDVELRHGCAIPANLAGSVNT